MSAGLICLWTYTVLIPHQLAYWYWDFWEFLNSLLLRNLFAPLGPYCHQGYLGLGFDTTNELNNRKPLVQTVGVESQYVSLCCNTKLQACPFNSVHDGHILTEIYQTISTGTQLVMFLESHPHQSNLHFCPIFVVETSQQRTANRIHFVRDKRCINVQTC